MEYEMHVTTSETDSATLIKIIEGLDGLGLNRVKRFYAVCNFGKTDEMEHDLESPNIMMTGNHTLLDVVADRTEKAMGLIESLSGAEANFEIEGLVRINDGKVYTNDVDSEDVIQILERRLDGFERILPPKAPRYENHFNYRGVHDDNREWTRGFNVPRYELIEEMLRGHNIKVDQIVDMTGNNPMHPSIINRVGTSYHSKFESLVEERHKLDRIAEEVGFSKVISEEVLYVGVPK